MTRGAGSAAEGTLDESSAGADLSALLRHEVIDARDDPEPLEAEIAAFVEAVRGGRPPKPGPEEGLRAVVLAEQVVKEMAAAAGRWPVPEMTARRP